MIKKRYSDKKIKLMISEVEATQAMEGLYLTEDEKNIFKKYLKGEITEEEILKMFSKLGVYNAKKLLVSWH